MSELPDERSRAQQEADDWRCSLQFFESAVQYLTARQAEMTLDRAKWNDGLFQTNANLVASASRGAEIARRNLARLDAPEQTRG